MDPSGQQRMKQIDYLGLIKPTSIFHYDIEEEERVMKIKTKQKDTRKEYLPLEVIDKVAIDKKKHKESLNHDQVNIVYVRNPFLQINHYGNKGPVRKSRSADEIECLLHQRNQSTIRYKQRSTSPNVSSTVDGIPCDLGALLSSKLNNLKLRMRNGKDGHKKTVGVRQLQGTDEESDKEIYISLNKEPYINDDMPDIVVTCDSRPVETVASSFHMSSDMLY